MEICHDKPWLHNFQILDWGAFTCASGATHKGAIRPLHMPDWNAGSMSPSRNLSTFLYTFFPINNRNNSGIFALYKWHQMGVWKKRHHFPYFRSISCFRTPKWHANCTCALWQCDFTSSRLQALPFWPFASAKRSELTCSDRVVSHPSWWDSVLNQVRAVEGFACKVPNLTWWILFLYKKHQLGKRQFQNNTCQATEQSSTVTTTPTLTSLGMVRPVSDLQIADHTWKRLKTQSVPGMGPNWWTPMVKMSKYIFWSEAQYLKNDIHMGMGQYL